MVSEGRQVIQAAGEAVSEVRHSEGEQEQDYRIVHTVRRNRQPLSLKYKGRDEILGSVVSTVLMQKVISLN